jgi:hypothetical protein
VPRDTGYETWMFLEAEVEIDTDGNFSFEGKFDVELSIEFMSDEPLSAAGDVRVEVEEAIKFSEMEFDIEIEILDK